MLCIVDIFPKCQAQGLLRNTIPPHLHSMEFNLGDFSGGIHRQRQGWIQNCLLCYAVKQLHGLLLSEQLLCINWENLCHLGRKILTLAFLMWIQDFASPVQVRVCSGCPCRDLALGLGAQSVWHSGYICYKRFESSTHDTVAWNLMLPQINYLFELDKFPNLRYWAKQKQNVLWPLLNQELWTWVILWRCLFH